MKLIQAIPIDILTGVGGIFSFIYATHTNDLPWLSDFPEITASELDMDYFGNHSGEKETSALIDKILTKADVSELNANHMTALANLIYDKYHINMERLWETMKVEYNPLDTYSVVKTENGTDTHNEVRDLSYTNSNTVEREYTDNSDTTSNSTVDDNVYAFNSTLPSPSDTSTVSNTNNTQDTGTTNDTTEGSSTDTGTISKTRTPNLTTTTKGNIFTSQQKLIEQERTVWTYNYFNEIYKMLDEVLTAPIYSY